MTSFFSIFITVTYFKKCMWLRRLFAVEVNLQRRHFGARFLNIKHMCRNQCSRSGSGAFLTPGSRMVKNLDPDHISESLETIFGIRNPFDPG
jgi:hypothetical protein